jgi:decaprenylphospho-beta-D-ribofuranose 2-oxidase
MADRLLTGWGRTAPSRADVVSAAAPENVAALVRAAGARGILARGLGRSYGDAAQNGGGTVVSLRDTVEIGPVDATGLVRCSAGTSVDELLRRVVPQGWFVPVTPGTRHVTLGGALATDVHGKNHHRDGSIAAHVTSVRLVDGAGAVRDLTPADEAFPALPGGMGLTGIVTDLTLRLRPVTSAWMTVHTERTADLDDTMRALTEADAHSYSVAWIDCLSESARGIVTSGEHAPADAVPGGDPLAFTPRTLAAAPAWTPPRLLSRASIAAFNTLYYLAAARTPPVSRQHAASFFHPLDVVRDWNRLYGAPGFVQHQFVVADPELVRWALGELRAARAPSFLTVLKRFGPSSGAPLSFPLPGWTLAVDLPAGMPGLAELLDRLDERICADGGRIYLAKDSRLRPELLPTMYPELDRWLGLRAQLDPHGVFSSDLSRRLQL